MIWLPLAAFCSVSIALILKINEGRKGSRLVIAGANYLVASAISLAMAGGIRAVPAASTLALGAAAGVVYVLGFLALMAGIGRGPLAVPVTVSRLSVAVPVVVSIALWSERPGAAQWAGIALGCGAVALFGFGASSRGAPAGRGYGRLMAALFFVLGAGDILLKAFREAGPDAERAVFTWILFTVAAAVVWACILLRRVPVERRAFLLGLALGLPNLGSTIFTLLALRTVPASIAFPLVNLAVVAGSTALGYLAWRERLGRAARAGLAVAAAAIVLLAAG